MWCICSGIVGLLCLKTSPLWFIAVSSLLLVAVFALCVSSALRWDAWVVDELGIVGVACCVSSASTSIGWVGCAITGDVVGSRCILSVWYVLPAVLTFCLNSSSDICLNNSLPCSSLNCSIASAPSKKLPSGLLLKKVASLLGNTPVIFSLSSSIPIISEYVGFLLNPYFDILFTLSITAVAIII